MKTILWILLGLILLMPAIWLAELILIGVSSLFISKQKEYSDDHPFYRMLINLVVWNLCVFGRVRLKVTGMEKIPENSRFLFVSNHRSNFDPLILMYLLPHRHISFVSKQGNFDIPAVGRVIHRCCFLVIDREDPRKAIKTINAAAELIEKGPFSIGIYPEGTRSKTCELLPFHDGVLKIAQKAKVPVLVATMQGVENIHKNFPFRSTEVRMDFIDCIEEPEKIKTSVLGARVRSEIEENLKK